MAVKAQLQGAIDALKTAADTFASAPEENLIRPDLGPLKFSENVDDAAAVKIFSQRVKNCSWTGVPLEPLRTCKEKFDQLYQVANQIAQFNPMKSGNVSGEIQAFSTDFHTRWCNLYNYVAPHLCFAESFKEGQNDPLESQKASAMAAVDAIKKTMASVQQEQNRMKTLTEEIEKMARQSGVTNEAVHFKMLADKYKVAAIAWGFGAATFGSVLFLYVTLLKLPPADHPTLLAQEYIPRLINITLISTGLIFCIRNFSAMMHNTVINRHRQTALTTFKTFVNSTDDKATKNAVLVQSTQAIFSPQQTGYLKSEIDAPQVNQVTEIFRGMTDKNG